MNRREFGAVVAAIAAMPAIGELRERRIGWGCALDNSIDLRESRLIHETFAIERWDGERWVDTHERREWCIMGGVKKEWRRKLTQMEISWLKGTS